MGSISSNQEIALRSLSSLTSLLRNKTKEDYSSESTLVEQGGENLLLSLGNVLNSAAQKASVIGGKVLPKNIRNKVINAMKGVAHLGHVMIAELIVCLILVSQQDRIVDRQVSTTILPVFVRR